jgi:hypothetical protein
MRRVEIQNHTIHPDDEHDACLGDWLACYGYMIDHEPRLLKGLVPRNVYRWALRTWGRTGKYPTFQAYREAQRLVTFPLVTHSSTLTSKIA